MRILIQRVKQAKVEVEEKTIGQIGPGLMLFVCFEASDDETAIELACEKILKLRIFEDENGKMNKSILDVQKEILSISQFTLSWDGKKGHRPSFDKSMQPQNAKIFYKLFNDELEKRIATIQKGQFGADMQVFSQNDGPVTFMLEF